jgi:hypothetical protein
VEVSDFLGFTPWFQGVLWNGVRVSGLEPIGRGIEMSGLKNGRVGSLPVTAGDVRHLAGPVTDDTVAAVLKTDSSMEDLEIAASYLRGEGSAVDRLGHPMAGKVAQLYDILSADALYADEEE